MSGVACTPRRLSAQRRPETEGQGDTPSGWPPAPARWTLSRADTKATRKRLSAFGNVRARILHVPAIAENLLDASTRKCQARLNGFCAAMFMLRGYGLCWITFLGTQFCLTNASWRQHVRCRADGRSGFLVYSGGGDFVLPHVDEAQKLHSDMQAGTNHAAQHSVLNCKLDMTTRMQVARRLDVDMPPPLVSVNFCIQERGRVIRMNVKCQITKPCRRAT